MVGECKALERRHSKQLQEQQKDQDLEVKLMNKVNQCVIDNVSNTAEAPSIFEKLSEKSTWSSYGDDLTLAKALFERTVDTTLITWGNEGFSKQIQSRYREDKLFALVLNKPNEYPDFTIKDDLIW
jgi:uncharacterized protein YaiL (DUF2058 family)